jgi:hypothetical protein
MPLRTAENSRKVALRGFGDDFGERGFADAGRTPEDHGGGVVVLDLDAEGFAGADEVLLAGVFGEIAGAHALGERGALGGGRRIPGWLGGRTGWIPAESWLPPGLPLLDAERRAGGRLRRAGRWRRRRR